MKFKKLVYIVFLVTYNFFSNHCFCQIIDSIPSRYDVTLKEAHIGSTVIDTMLLNSYAASPSNILKFYLDSRGIFEESHVDFTNPKIVETALNNNVGLMGGPMLGDVNENGISIWFRPSNTLPIHVNVIALDRNTEKVYILNPTTPGKEERLIINDLFPSATYKYVVSSQENIVAEGIFSTTPKIEEKKHVRITFGSCSHKIGLHNPNLVNAILKREPHAMMLLGDIAVDDRENNFSMHRSDYLLRDISGPWRKLAANVPLYTSWDDHDYLNNDLSGVPKRFTDEDREELRTLWHRNWNNPKNDLEGIYFNTRMGQVELIMLDTRSCREVEKRGAYGSYLGKAQLEWLKNILEHSTATFKVISSGTMWSDYITNGKDSWGTWDTIAREEIFNLIERKNIPGVLLISGDRHGARGFKIPRNQGFDLFEFEAASLGGVPGPPAMANDTTKQLFGYNGLGLKAFGEFTFSNDVNGPKVVFRLINEFGVIMEDHLLSYDMLTPQKQ